MLHEMKVNSEPFGKIYDGIKTIELRLYDKKRQAVAVGDTIIFRCSDNSDLWVEAEVIALHRFPTFKELYAALPLTKCGYTDETAVNAFPDDMLIYYPEGAQRKSREKPVLLELSLRLWEKPDQSSD